MKKGQNVELVYKLLGIDLYITHVFEFKMNSTEETGPTHKQWREWLETGENVKYVRYTQKCIQHSLERAEWDLDGEEFKKALYANLVNTHKSDKEYFNGKFDRFKDRGIVTALGDRDGRNIGGWYEWQMHYMYHFGLGNFAWYRKDNEEYKKWLKKENLD